MRICFACIEYWELYIHNKPLMIVIALVLALMEKSNDNMGLAEYVADADKCDQQPSRERDKATYP